MTLFALVRLDVDCVDYTKRCIVLSCFGLACAIGAHAHVATSLEAQGPCRGRNPEAAPAAQLDRRAAPADGRGAVRVRRLREIRKAVESG